MKGKRNRRAQSTRRDIQKRTKIFDNTPDKLGRQFVLSPQVKKDLGNSLAGDLIPVVVYKLQIGISRAIFVFSFGLPDIHVPHYILKNTWCKEQYVICIIKSRTAYFIKFIGAQNNKKPARRLVCLVSCVCFCHIDCTTSVRRRRCIRTFACRIPLTPFRGRT